MLSFSTLGVSLQCPAWIPGTLCMNPLYPSSSSWLMDLGLHWGWFYLRRLTSRERWNTCRKKKKKNFKKCPDSCFSYFSLFSSNFYIPDIWGEEAGAMLPRYCLLLPHFKTNSVQWYCTLCLGQFSLPTILSSLTSAYSYLLVFHTYVWACQVYFM